MKVRWSVALLLATITACGSEEGGANVTNQSQPADVSDQSSLIRSDRAVLTASLQLSPSKTVELYDFKTGAMVVERGNAYEAPVVQTRGLHADDLDDLWKRLAPSSEVPDAVHALQERLSNLTTEDSTDTVLSPDVGGAESALDSNQAAAPQAMQGCNNGCCDYGFLATLDECQGGGDYSWLLYNYGVSFANLNDIIYYSGVACAAVGTSTYSVNIGGKGGTWSVAEGTYFRYTWVAGFNAVTCLGYCGKNMTSFVNSSASQHLHSYCGITLYDAD